MRRSSDFLVVKKSSLEKTNKIVYGRVDGRHGKLLIAFECDLICAVQFIRENDACFGLNELSSRFPSHSLVFHQEKIQENLDSMKERPVVLLKGTSFQMDVWMELLKIPHGERVSYSDLSKRICRKNAERAVGNAVGRNPLAILVPCHRVVRKDGSLGGYYWGVQKKRSLLNYEKEHFQRGDIYSLLGGSNRI